MRRSDIQPIRRLLKRSTDALHHEVEAGLMSLLAPGETGYCEFLCAIAAAVIPIERGLEAGGVIRCLPDWRERSRRRALRADLAELGLDEPVPAESPAFAGEAGMLGAVYVLEGSRLGARRLAAWASASPSARVRSATRFLRHGVARHFWTSYLECLESSPAVRRSPGDAVSGARQAFAIFLAEAKAVRPPAALQPSPQLIGAR